MNNRAIPTGLMAFAAFSLGVAAFGQPGGGVQENQEPEGVYSVRELSPQMQNLWKRTWAPMARRCALWEGRYYILPTYDQRYANSMSMTLQDAIRKKQKTVLRRGAGLITKRTVNPEKEEAEAMAYLLPDIVIGHYGYIHSARIEMIVDEKTMIVSHVKLVDEEELRDGQRDLQQDLRERNRNRDEASGINDYIESRYEERTRLAQLQESERFESPLIVKGFDTFGLAKGMDWKPKADSEHGIHIAIVDEQKYDRGRQKDTFFVAIPMTAFDRTLNEREFIAMLRESGMGLDKFCQKLLDHKQRNPKDADALMYRELLDVRPELDPMIDPREQQRRDEEAERDAEREKQRLERERERAERDAERERRRQERDNG